MPANYSSERPVCRAYETFAAAGSMTLLSPAPPSNGFGRSEDISQGKLTLRDGAARQAQAVGITACTLLRLFIRFIQATMFGVAASKAWPSGVARR